MRADHRRALRYLASIVVSMIGLAGLIAAEAHPVGAQGQPDDKMLVWARLNDVRRANGLPPLARNTQLDQAAQRHSDDMADKGFVDETGSDGSSPRQRIEATGYARWPGVRIWAESIYAGQSTFDEALDFLLGDDGQRRTLLSPRLREVGIGIARDSLRTYWTLTFGAQPNLLPVFINDDAPVTNERQVAVLLTQEEAVPAGDVNAIGRVLEIRISDRPDFAGADWQPWERLIPFTLSGGSGTKTIYVEMRDGAGRTTIATDSIVYDPNARDVVRPMPPGAIEAAAANDPLAQPTPEPVITAEPIAPEPTAAAIANPVAVVVTLAPERPSAVTPAQTPAQTPAAAGAEPGAVVVVLQPTATPTPAAPPLTSIVVATPSAEDDVRQFEAAPPGAPPADWIVPVYLVAQGSVILLALTALLRRK